MPHVSKESPNFRGGSSSSKRVSMNRRTAADELTCIQVVGRSCPGVDGSSRVSSTSRKRSDNVVISSETRS